MAQLVAALITVHGLLSFLLDVYVYAYDRFLDTASSRRVKNRKNWVPASSDNFMPLIEVEMSSFR